MLRLILILAGMPFVGGTLRHSSRVDGVMAANHETNENETEPIQTPKQVSSDDYVNGIGTSRIVRRPLANAGVAGGP